MANEYVISRVVMRDQDGNKRKMKVNKSVYDIEAYRKYLIETENVIGVEFIYETIPGECKRELRV